MNVAIVGDSHIPSREAEIPESFAEHIAAADHVLHTGDFDSEGALANLRAEAPDLTAVAGNMDPTLGLPETATVELGGIEFVLTHGTGPPKGWHDRLAELVVEQVGPAGVGVAGHTHRVVDEVHNGVRLLNPGSVTGAMPAEAATMFSAEVADGEIDVTHHEL
jgi:putative phosphoesterase